jgi:hypothetical protein
MAITVEMVVKYGDFNRDLMEMNEKIIGFYGAFS